MKKFDKLTIYLIPIGIAINFVGGQLAVLLKLPVYLDAIGTIVTGALCGIWPGVIVAVLTQLINSISLPTLLPYVVIGIAFAFISAFLAKKGMFSSFPKAIVNGLVIALISTCMAVPITAFLYGGFVGTGASVIVTALMTAGWGVVPATFVSELSTEVVDKLIVLIICYFVIKSIPKRFVVKLPQGKYFVKDLNSQED